jgi:hypothetical protein
MPVRLLRVLIPRRPGPAFLAFVAFLGLTHDSASQIHAPSRFTDRVEVIDWIDKSGLPIPSNREIPRARLILVGDLDLTDMDYSSDPAHHVVIVAGTVRLKGEARFNLDHERRGSLRRQVDGGDLTIVALRVIFEPDAVLRVSARGLIHPFQNDAALNDTDLEARRLAERRQFTKMLKDNPSEVERDRIMTVMDRQTRASGSDRDPVMELAALDAFHETGGKGGRFCLFAGAFEAPRSVPSGPGPGPDEIARRHLVADLAGGFRAGSAHLIRRDLERAAEQASPGSFAAWAEARIRHLHGSILDAERRSDRPALVVAFAQLADIPPAPALNVEVRSLVAQLLALRDKHFPPVYRLSLVDARVALEVFGHDTSPYVLASPTTLLVRPITMQGRRVLGIIQVDPKDPKRLEVRVDAAMALDPRDRREADRVLARRGQAIAGVFRDWELHAARHGPDFLDLDARLVGDTLKVVMGLDSAHYSAVLLQLAGGTGIPLELGYQLRGDESIKGRLTLPLSIARTSEPELTVGADGIVNRGMVELNVGSVCLPDGRLVDVPGGMAIPPKCTLPLSKFGAARLAGATVPPEHVVATALDPFDPVSLFFVPPRDVLMTATVSNYLSLNDPAPRSRGELRSVDVALVVVSGGGPDPVEIDLGAHALIPHPFDRSPLKLRFLRSGRGPTRLRYRGTATYVNGFRGFEGEVDGLNLEIRDSSLRPE